MSLRKKLLLGEPLTEREREIVVYVAQGWGNFDIADLAFISERTVRTHMVNISAKLGAHNRTDAVRIAREMGIIDGDETASHDVGRFTHRNGGGEPPTVPGNFWMEIPRRGERVLVRLAKAIWGEWRMQRFGGEWEAYEPESLRELGACFWGPIPTPWDEE